MGGRVGGREGGGDRDRDSERGEDGGRGEGERGARDMEGEREREGSPFLLNHETINNEYQICSMVRKEIEKNPSLEKNCFIFGC